MAGLFVIWDFDNRPGAQAHAPARWPSSTNLQRGNERSTLILLAHPQCSCTRATLAELAEVLVRVHVRPRTYVLFLRPESVAVGWEHTELWHMAERLPDATVVRDDDGVQARLFGAATSGQALLYDSDGILRFSGGITAARGHLGDNPASTALVAAINGSIFDRAWANVFGCPLFTSASSAVRKGETNGS